MTRTSRPQGLARRRPWRRMSRALSGAAALALLAAAGSAAPGPRASAGARRSVGARRPNLLLIVVDTLRADHLSAYGYSRPTSPHLDALAAQGTLYETAISAAPWTLPSHASLFTGLYPHQHHATSQQWRLADSFDTLAERLARAGYHTGGFANNVWLSDVSGLEQGFERFDELWRFQPSKGDQGISFDDPKTDMGAARTNTAVLGWLDGLPHDGKPFFTFINYFEPHMPYRPTQPFATAFLPAGVDAATVQRLRSFYTPREYGYILRAPWMEVPPRDLEVLRALYDGEIAYDDAMIGRLLDGLRARHLLADTVVVITSDHGEHLGDHHMLGHKLSIYDSLLHVPLIVWGPGRVAAGVRLQRQVQTTGVFGTMLDFAGAAPPGAATLPTREGPDGYAYAELAFPKIFLDVAKDRIAGWKTDRFARALTTVRGERYKLISGSDGSRELYDLRQDPGETHDLAATEPQALGRLERMLHDFLGGSATGPVNATAGAAAGPGAGHGGS